MLEIDGSCLNAVAKAISKVNLGVAAAIAVIDIVATANGWW